MECLLIDRKYRVDLHEVDVFRVWRAVSHSTRLRRLSGFGSAGLKDIRIRSYLVSRLRVIHRCDTLSTPKSSMHERCSSISGNQVIVFIYQCAHMWAKYATWVHCSCAGARSAVRRLVCTERDLLSLPLFRRREIRYCIRLRFLRHCIVASSHRRIVGVGQKVGVGGKSRSRRGKVGVEDVTLVVDKRKHATSGKERASYTGQV